MKSTFIALFLFISSDITKAEVFYRKNGLREISSQEDRAASIEFYVTQKLDNFDSGNTSTWQNRYFQNDEFFLPGHPIFLLMLGELNAGSYIGYLKYGLMAEAARELGAHVVILEHRFYGASVPNDDLSLDNLKYLSIEQAMADAANLIQELKKKPEFTNSKVIVFGGSYGGVLAANMRQTYPNIVNGAVASSAPLKPVVEFTQYLEQVNASLNNVTCTKTLNVAFHQLQGLFDNPRQHIKIFKDFRLCRPIDGTDKTLDEMTLFQQLTVIIGNSVQYATAQSIKDLCSILCLPTTLDDYSRLVNYVNIYLGQHNANCLALYPDYIDELKNKSSNNMFRSWIYQQCTQFGDLITTGSSKRPFLDTVPLQWWENVCSDAFNIENPIDALGAATDKLLSNYGGDSPSASKFTNIITTQGSLDPWMPLGLKQPPNSDSYVYIIKDASHTADLAPSTDYDSVQLKSTRDKINDVLKDWIN